MWPSFNELFYHLAQANHLCLLFPEPAFLSGLCIAFSQWYVQFLVCVMYSVLVCIVLSFRYTTARIR